MPKKGYKLTKEHKRKISESLKGEKNPFYGKRHSEDAKKKMRISKIGKYCGEKNPMYGKHHTKETKEKISNINKGRPSSFLGKKHSIETRMKIKEILKDKKDKMRYWKGKKRSEETKRKVSKKLKGRKWTENQRNIMKIKMKGKNNPFYGKHHSHYTKINLSNLHKGSKHTEETKNKIRMGNSGEKCHLWKGGKSFEPYTLDFNNWFKKNIRKRDNYCCIICNTPQEELDRLLCVHHIDYNKKNCFPQNCVSLCRSCHTKTNFNQQHWKVFFQSLLKERYKYEYTQDQKIILDYIKRK